MPFRDVIGHDRLVALLARSIRDNRLPPSLIFGGPSGVGKRLTAIAVAQAFNCVSRSSEAEWASGGGDRQRRPVLDTREGSGPSASGVGVGPHAFLDDSCGKCPACTRIARGVHPDVILIEPGDSGSIKTEQVRECIDRAAYRPFEGRRRVVIIDQADALVASAQNALLKTLEEPPSASSFILVSARSDLLLPTVRSRCPRLAFRPLDVRFVVQGLIARGLSAERAQTLAASAEGSLGRALELSADDLLEARAVAHQVLAGAASSDDPRRRIEGAKAWVGSTGGIDRVRMAAHLRAMASLIRT
jgi:DNA polymerase-3 subunit delta'